MFWVRYQTDSGSPLGDTCGNESGAGLMDATALHANIIGEGKNGTISEATRSAPDLGQPRYSLPRNGAVLSSWKEIATYLGRGVRTVQRWERNADLPVQRPNGANRGPVLAIPGELDRWISRSSPHPNSTNGEYTTESLAARLTDLARALLAEGERLLLLSQQQSPEAHKVIASLRTIVAELMPIEGEAIASGSEV
jgi:hypothetical protein